MSSIFWRRADQCAVRCDAVDISRSLSLQPIIGRLLDWSYFTVKAQSLNYLVLAYGLLATGCSSRIRRSTTSSTLRHPPARRASAQGRPLKL
jgi:hypothetical protein